MMSHLLTHLTARVSVLRGALADMPLLHRFIGGEAQPKAALVQGFIASCLVLLGSVGVGWLAQTQTSIFARTTVLNPLRTTPAGVIICALLLAFGSLLLVRSWLRLSQRLAGWGEESLPVVRKAILWWSLPLIFTFPIFSRDVFSYLGQGRLMVEGLSPYTHWISMLPGWFMQGSDGLWAESASPYGPLFLWLAQGIYFITAGVPEAGILLFRLVALAGLLLCTRFIPRLARSFGSDPGWALWITVANPLFLLNIIAGVHNDSLMIGALLAGLYYLRTGKHVRGVLLIAVSISIKPITILALPFAGLLWAGFHAPLRAKILAWVKVALISGVYLTVLGFASGLWFGWIKAMATAGSAAFPYAPVGLLGLGLGQLGSLAGLDGVAVANAVFSAGKLAAVALTVWLAFQHRLTNPVLCLAYALTASVVLAPIIQPWYVLWLLPLFAVCRVYSGLPVKLVYLLVSALVLVGVIDQLSVAQWIDSNIVRAIAAVIGLAYIGYLVMVDPKTSSLFGLIQSRPERIRTPDKE